MTSPLGPTTIRSRPASISSTSMLAAARSPPSAMLHVTASSAPVPGTSTPTHSATRSTPIPSLGGFSVYQEQQVPRALPYLCRPALCRVPVGCHPALDHHGRHQGRLLSHGLDPIPRRQDRRQPRLHESFDGKLQY